LFILDRSPKSVIANQIFLKRSLKSCHKKPMTNDK